MGSRDYLDHLAQTACLIPALWLNVSSRVLAASNVPPDPEDRKGLTGLRDPRDRMDLPYRWDEEGWVDGDHLVLPVLSAIPESQDLLELEEWQGHRASLEPVELANEERKDRLDLLEKLVCQALLVNVAGMAMLVQVARRVQQASQGEKECQEITESAAKQAVRVQMLCTVHALRARLCSSRGASGSELIDDSREPADALNERHLNIF